MASSSGNPYEGGGGIGGKIRRRTSRPASTPYARPTEAARTTAGGALATAGSSGWISKLVDPASRFIAGSASRLLSSVFTKKLPALQNAPVSNSSSPGEMIHEVEEEEELPPLTTPANQLSEVPGQIVSDTTRNNEQKEDVGPKMDDRLPERPDNSGMKIVDKGPMNSITTNLASISEIEQLLTHKTLTKEQFDRLTDLLRARTVEPDLPNCTPSNKEKEATVLIPPIRQDLAESSKKHVMFSTPANTALAPKQEASSPAELAKAYMSGRSFTGSSSALRIRTPIFTERKPSPFLTDSRTMHVSAKSPTSSLALAARPNAVPISPLFESNKDGYATPRSLGRTAISRMCRSPFVKGAGSSGSAYASTFSPYDTPTGGTSGGKQVLKRGSAALYDDIGTVGPIRRIRQKLNMIAPQKEPTPSPYKNFTRTNPSTLKTGTNQAATSAQKPLELPLNNDSYDSDMRDESENEEMKSCTFSFNQVPPRSTEVASKILDVVGKIVRDKSPSPNRDVRQIEAPPLQKKEKQKVDISTYGKSEVKFSHQNNGVDMAGSNASTKRKAVLDGSSGSVPAPQITKPSFRMSVPEDLLDDDDDDTSTETETTVPVKNVFNKVESSTSEKKKIESNMVPEPKVTNLEPVPTAAVSSPSTQTENRKTTLASPVSETTSGFTFSSDVKFQMPPTPTMLSTPDDSSNKKDENAPPKAPAPLVGFGLKQQEKPEASPFSWVTSNAGAKVDTETSKPAAADASDSDKSGQKRKSEEVPKPIETSIAPPAAQSSPPIFSFGALSSPSLSNGTHSSPPKFSFAASPAVTPSPESVNPVSSEPAISTTAASAGFSSPAPDVPKIPVNPFSSGPAVSPATVSAGFGFSSPAMGVSKMPSFQFGASTSAGSQAEQSPVPGAKISEPNPVQPFAFGSGTTNIAGTTSSSAVQNAGSSSSTTTTGTTTFGLFSSTAVVSGLGTGTGAGTGAGTGIGTGTETGAGTGTGTGTGSATFLFGNTGSTSAFTFGASSQPTSSSSSQSAFNFGATNTNSNSGASVFNFGSSSQNPSSSSSIASSTTSQATFAFGAAKPVQSEAQPTQPVQSQSSGSQFSTVFSSSASSPALFGATSTGFSFSSNAMSSNSSQSGLFGSGFGSASSTAPSIFSTTSFGANTSGATPSATGFSFGQSSSAPGSSFAFGAQPQSNATFSFGLSNPNSGTGASTGFGLASPGTNNDQMSMEDSMLDDTSTQAAKLPPVPAFGQPVPAFGQPAPMFGQSVPTASPGAFAFAAQPSQTPPAFQPPASNLEFNAGNTTFSAGSNAGDKGNRRIVRVNRNKVRGRK